MSDYYDKSIIQHGKTLPLDDQQTILKHLAETIYRMPLKSKPLPNDYKIVLNRIKVCQ